MKHILSSIIFLMITIQLYAQQSPEQSYQQWLASNEIGQVLKLSKVRQFDCCKVLAISFVEDSLHRQLEGWKALKELYPEHTLTEKLFMQGVTLWQVHPDSFGVSIVGGTEALKISADFSENRIHVYGDTLDLDNIGTKSKSTAYELDLAPFYSTTKKETKTTDTKWKNTTLNKRLLELIQEYFSPYAAKVEATTPFNQSTFKVKVDQVRGCLFKDEHQSFLCSLRRWAFGEDNCDERPKERFYITISYSPSTQKITFTIDGQVASGRTDSDNYRIMDKIGYDQQLQDFTDLLSTHIYNKL